MPKWKHAVAVLLVLCLGLTGLLFIRARTSDAAAISAFDRSIASDTSYQAQAASYRALLNAIGPQAQDMLLARFPPDSRSHVINHESGAYLYRHEGLAGLADCKNYFNGSCYHGFIETLLADRGFGALQEVVTACSGGRSIEQARECSHGVGHAFLIAAGYEKLPDALSRCRSTFASSTRAIGDCDDGVFMENNFGGFSVPPKDRWYDAADPLYPCDAAQIRSDAIAHDSCWFMQSQATLNATMYPRFGGDPKNVAAFCSAIDTEGDRRTCDQGLARQIQARSGGNLEAILSACSAAYPEAPGLCYADAAESAYSFGAEAAAIALCERSGSYEDQCFDWLYARISSTAYHSLAERLEACGRMGEESRIEACENYAAAAQSAE